MASPLFRVRMPADRSSISCEKVGLTCERSFASTAQKTNCPTGAEKPLRGVSAEMTDLELMQISVPFHEEGSPHGVGCHNQRLPTAAGYCTEWPAAVPALTKKSHKVSKTGGFMKRIIRFPFCTFVAIRTLV